MSQHLKKGTISAQATPKVNWGPKLWDATRNTATKFSPRKVIANVRDSVAQYKEARATKDEDLIIYKPDSTKEVDKPTLITKIKLKFAAGIAVSEVIGTYLGALSFGSITQILTKSPYWGLAGTILGDYIPAVLSFDIVWYLLNKKYYDSSSNSILGELKNFAKDVIPMHLLATLAVLPNYILSSTLLSGLIATSEKIHEGIGKFLPIPLLCEITNGIIGEAIYLIFVVYLMKASKILDKFTEKYSNYLNPEQKIS